MVKEISELEPNTLINSKEQGHYIKDENGLWYELYPHCGDCGDIVSDEGTSTPSKCGSEVTVAEPAAEYFGEFIIVAIPYKGE